MKEHHLGPITYFINGKTPTTLFLSGMHGDESETIKPLTDIINKFSPSLPGFLFIPEASPTALALNRRNNQNNLDLNRAFFDSATDPEVVSLMKIVRPHTFNYCFSFHEDPTTSQFYLYESGQLDDQTLSGFKNHLRAAHIQLFSGIDDPDDPTLGHRITNGYLSLTEFLLIPTPAPFGIGVCLAV